MEKRPSLVAFIDVEGAFNNISREAITEGMVALDVNPMIIRWVDQCLSHRVLTSAIKDTTASKSVSNWQQRHQRPGNKISTSGL